MAGDWIKMRVWLRRDPRVATISDFLAEQREFMNWVTDPVQQSCKNSVYEHVTSDVTRSITVSSLLEIWGVARDRGDRDEDDLVLSHCDVAMLDDICGTPVFGEAMEFVGWVEGFQKNGYNGNVIQCVRFPKFFKHEEAPEDRYKRQHAEAQARYRLKKVTKSDITSDSPSDITMTPREEKRREENKETPTPIPPPTRISGKKPQTTFKTFLENCKASGERPVSSYKPVFDYAAKIGLPPEFVALCWNEFRRRYGPGGTSSSKRYADWRQAFRKCVEGNWFKLWYADGDKYLLTTQGMTAEKANRGDAQ